MRVRIGKGIRLAALGSPRLVLGTVLVLGLLAHPTWAARDICKMLKDKGVLNDVEYNECKAAQEKQDAEAEGKVKEVMGVKLPKWLDVLTPFGDLRLRGEGFYGNGLHARHRFRLRARIGLAANLSDELSATVRLASGDPNNPISRNQSFQNAFTEKPFSLDQAFLTLKPGKTFGIQPGWIAITAGKFSANAYRTSELVWDDDLTPEGATETVYFLDRKEGFARNLRLNMFQWVIDEVSTDADPWMGGGQLVADTAIGSAATWSLAFADYHFEGMNGVASKFLNQFTDAMNTKTNANFNSQLANSNSVVKDAATNKVTGYKSRFNVIDVGSELNFANPFSVGIPAGLFTEVAYNTQADNGRDVGVYLGAGIGKAGKDWYHDALKAAGDWGASYTWAWVEKDAVLSPFSFDDLDYSLYDTGASHTQKGSTNVNANILKFDYMLLSNLQLTAKTLLINALDRKNATTTTGSALDKPGNPTLIRAQLDALVRF